MAYTTLPIVTTGDFWTLTQAQIYFRDNWIASVPDICSALGSIFSGTGDGTGMEVLVGANYEVLQANSTDPRGVEWGRPRMCFPTILIKSGDQTLAGVSEDVVWETEVADVMGLHTGASSDIDFTEDAVFLVICHLALSDTNHSTTFYGELIQNATAFARSFWERQDGDIGYVNLFAVWPFLSTDTLKVKVTAPASPTLKVLQGYSRLTVMRLGAWSP